MGEGGGAGINKNVTYAGSQLTFEMGEEGGAGINKNVTYAQGCIFCLTCSLRELAKDHVLTSAYVEIFRTVTRNAVNKSVWKKKNCS